MIKLPNKSLKEIEKFFSENQELINKYMVRRIAKSIQDNKDVATMFVMASGEIAAVKRSDFAKVLTEAMGKFSESEDYEYAGYCRRVLDKWYIEQLINNTKNTE